jgi:hypothetical protein
MEDNIKWYNITGNLGDVDFDDEEERKPGRPRTRNERASEVITLRFTKTQFSRLEWLARVKGMTIPELFRAWTDTMIEETGGQNGT